MKDDDFSLDFVHSSIPSTAVDEPFIGKEGLAEAILYQERRHSFEFPDSAHIIRQSRKSYTYDEVEKEYKAIPRQRADTRSCPDLEDIIPAVRFGREYKCSQDFIPDLISGLTVAALHLPQGLAYGLLANLTPISGIYTSIFSVAVYVVFGTVPHMSMGTNAVLSLITAAMVEREADLHFSSTNSTNAETEGEEEESKERMNFKLGVAMASTFQCGVMLLLMGLLRMGFLTNYMPSSFVGGFTSAAALHIAVSQMKHVFHIKVPVRAGPGTLVYSLMDVARGVGKTNFTDVIVCVASAGLLIFLDKAVNPQIKAALGHALPANLLMVTAGLVASLVLDLHSRYGVAVIGSVGSGLPLPHLPPMDKPLHVNILYDSATQAVIVFTMSIAMAMLMAKVHEYELDSNRELVAYGACNLASSFFHVQSSSVSPPRTMVLSNSGARTTFNGVPTALVLLAGVSFLGGVFEPLPKATLAAMIIVAVLDVILQVRVVPGIWRVSRTDWLVWTSTWAATTFVGLEYGIVTGVLIAALGFMVNNQYIRGELVVHSVKEDLLIPGSHRAQTAQFHKARVFYFPSQLFFANAESFKRQLYHHVFDPAVRERESAHLRKSMDSDCSLSHTKSVSTIILDCSAMTYMDIDGLNMLKAVILRYSSVGVDVLLARLPHSTMTILDRGDLFSLMPRSHVFHDVPDALAMATEAKLESTEREVTVGRVSTVGLTLGRSPSMF